MNEYDITIQETLEMTVTVEAESREEARQIVSDNWKKGEYILDADSFKDVKFYPTGRAMISFLGRSVFPCGEWNVYVPASIAVWGQTAAC